MNMIIIHPVIEEVLGTWQSCIGEDYFGYKGHVYRVFNYCLALRSCTEMEQEKLAVAAGFHDLGLWSDRTLDYLPPSFALADQYLMDKGRPEWAEEIGLMIAMHHKVRPCRLHHFPLVEIFRQGDLVDFSLGLLTCGLPRTGIRRVKQTFPNHGFHRFLLRLAAGWVAKHPLTAPPYLKW